MRRRTKALMILGALVLVSAVAGLILAPFSNDVPLLDENSNEIIASRSDSIPDDLYLTIMLMGDMLPHDSVNLNAKTDSGYDYTPYFSNIQSTIDKADVLVCNQESPSAGELYGVSGYPSFNAPTEFARDLSSVGCNAVSLANNHSGDAGIGGLEATIDAWQTINPLAFNGTSKSGVQSSPSYFEVDGYQFAFIAYTDHQNRSLGNSFVNDFDSALRLTRQASQEADFVIVSAHWGSEVNTSVLGSQSSQAAQLATAGADIITGTGPHVLQKSETIGKTTVFYSLGNMLSTQLELDQLIGGIGIIELSKNNNQLKLETVSLLPTYMHYEWSAQQQAREDLLSRQNLNIFPLTDSAEQLTRARYSQTVDELLEQVQETLGPNAKVIRSY